MLKHGFTFILIISLFGGCSKPSQSKLLGPGLALSIDAWPDSWHEHRQFFKDNGVKLTFYIEQYPKMLDSQKQKLRDFEADGSEVAHHTYTHAHADEYVAKYGMQQFIKNEILVPTIAMKRDGFHPLNFAYAHGDCTTETDVELANYFNSIRKIISPYGGKRICDMDQIYYRFGDITYYYACGIDTRYSHSLDEVYQALEYAKKSRTTICLYSHSISTNPIPLSVDISESYILADDLKKIVLKAKELGLTFYTAKDISRNKFSE